LRYKWRGFPKLVAVVGGFLMLIGIVLFGIAVLAFFGYLNVGLLVERKYLLMSAITMVAVGLLDAFAAVVVARW